MKGSYTLLLKLSEEIEIEVGSLNKIKFRKGFYAYNGSAFGPGGLKRVNRHIEKSENGKNPHWHIDYLLIENKGEIVDFFKSSSDHECMLSKQMAIYFDQIDGFGCSDCGCNSHLFFSRKSSKLIEFLEDFYQIEND
ncbi:MAG: GIY-YIG nuclease family protein [Candidatus Nanohaloarchaea archaeon]